MKSTAKGNQFELEVKKTLEASGWQVFRQHRKPMFIKGKMITVGADVFGCDLICKKQGNKPLWIQVSTLDNLSAKKIQVDKFPLLLEYENYEIWCRISGSKNYKVFKRVADGWEYIIDVQVVSKK